MNAVRTQTLLRRADVVVVRFGDKYRQWNAAFEAGYAAALGKPIVTLHDAELTHAAEGGRPRRDGGRRDARAGRRDPPLRDHRVAGRTAGVCAAGSRVGTASWDLAEAPAC